MTCGTVVGVLGGRLFFCEFHMLNGLVVADAGVLLALGSCLDVSGLVRCAGFA